MSFAVTAQFELSTCYKCGIQFAMPTWYRQKRIEDHADFYCPNGHAQHFSAETEAEIERRLRQRAEQQVARAEDEKLRALRREAALRSELNRHRKRAANGVCPCCNRSFVNMARHMKTQHPEFAGPKPVVKGAA